MTLHGNTFSDDIDVATNRLTEAARPLNSSSFKLTMAARLLNSFSPIFLSE